jgi:hypothetical protein
VPLVAHLCIDGGDGVGVVVVGVVDVIVVFRGGGGDRGSRRLLRRLRCII